MHLLDLGWASVLPWPPRACLRAHSRMSLTPPTPPPYWPRMLGGLGALTSTGSSFSSSRDMKAKVSAPCRADRS